MKRKITRERCVPLKDRKRMRKINSLIEGRVSSWARSKGIWLKKEI
jgi:hypothetical protein